MYLVAFSCLLSFLAQGRGKQLSVFKLKLNLIQLQQCQKNAQNNFVIHFVKFAVVIGRSVSYVQRMAAKETESNPSSRQLLCPIEDSQLQRNFAWILQKSQDYNQSSDITTTKQLSMANKNQFIDYNQLWLSACYHSDLN